MSRCVGLAAPAGSGRCPKEVSPPRQRRDGESQHGHVHLSPTNTYASPMWIPFCFSSNIHHDRMVDAALISLMLHCPSYTCDVAGTAVGWELGTPPIEPHRT